MKKQQRIGLVLSSVPGYSETFFRNKIIGLQQKGVEVVLFVIEHQKKMEPVLNCKVVQAPNLKGAKVKVVFVSMVVLLKVIFTAPKSCYKHYQLDRVDGISITICIKRLIQNAFLIKYKLDWLHYGFGMLAVGRENVAEAIGVKMGVSFRGFDLYLSPLKHKNCYHTLFQKKARYHVLSEEMKRDLEQYKVPASNIQVIPPAIDVNYFQRNAAKARGEVINFVTVARLHWKKGLIYTLEALAILKNKGVAFKYTIIGAGGEYERLVFAAHQLGVMDNLILVGKLAQDDVKTHLEQSDIYLQYSIQEGFCNAVLEAQAMGLLCVVSDAEGLSENVLHGETGWVVPKRKPAMLAQKIEEVMSLDTATALKIRNQAMERVKHEFNLEIQQNAFVNFYTL